MQEKPGNTPGVVYVAYNCPELYLPPREDIPEPPRQSTNWSADLRVVVDKLRPDNDCAPIRPESTDYNVAYITRYDSSSLSESNTSNDPNNVVEPSISSQSRVSNFSSNPINSVSRSVPSFTVLDYVRAALAKRQRMDSSVSSESSISTDHSATNKSDPRSHSNTSSFTSDSNNSNSSSIPQRTPDCSLSRANIVSIMSKFK